MKDLVEAARRETERSEREPSDDGPAAGEFGSPTCAVVGCGPVGAERLDTLDEQAAAGTGTPRPDRGAAGADIGLRLPLRDRRLPDGSSAEDSPDVGGAVGDADVVAVTAHLDGPAAARVTERVCRRLSAERTVLAVPTVPSTGLPEEAREAFVRLADAADTTVPFDLARIHEAFCSSDSAGREPLQVADSLVAEWLADVFAAVRGPVAAPCLRRPAPHELFDDGGVSVLYWGRGTREEVPAPLLEAAAAGRLCDGDRRTATGGVGFVRFGSPFTLGEFRSLEERSRERLCPDDVPDDDWIVCGDVAAGLGDDCRIALLVTGIDPASLPFL